MTLTDQQPPWGPADPPRRRAEPGGVREHRAVRRPAQPSSWQRPSPTGALPAYAPGLGALRFDAGPVRLLLRRRMKLDNVSLVELAGRLPLSRRTLLRLLTADTLPWTVADRCAVALGYHPWQLWPTWFLHRDTEPAGDLA